MPCVLSDITHLSAVPVRCCLLGGTTSATSPTRSGKASDCLTRTGKPVFQTTILRLREHSEASGPYPIQTKTLIFYTQAPTTPPKGICESLIPPHHNHPFVAQGTFNRRLEMLSMLSRPILRGQPGHSQPWPPVAATRSLSLCLARACCLPHRAAPAWPVFQAFRLHSSRVQARKKRKVLSTEKMDVNIRANGPAEEQRDGVAIRERRGASNHTLQRRSLLDPPLPPGYCHPGWFHDSISDTSLLQPLDMGGDQDFNCNYQRAVYREALKRNEDDSNDDSHDFWKQYNIRHALLTIKRHGMK
ncbi:hypothetical protein GWK47_054501 [Chionoecetes opilio]|uniref:Uncharacterized protein n=1 Tax=Chionoecetes opilio TaxID=41210 RepID=A0A8J4Y087_CHIOP|nr:hypothetical protein GWK47_054501 [Chionoecetes opilio]